MLEIAPYQQVGLIRFGMRDSEIVSLLGEPQSSRVTLLNETEYDYGHLLVQLGRKEGVVEVGISPGVEVSLAKINIFEDPQAFGRLLEIDGEPFELRGFIILLKLGITLTGFHDDDESQRAITVFTRGRWDNKRPKMKEFKIQS